VKKNFTALAIAVAGMTAQDAFATISATALTTGTQVQIGCTAPAANGATVYSLDTSALNTSLNPTVNDAIALPSGVSVGAACSQALSAMGLASIGASSTGRWVAPGVTTTSGSGVSPVNITIPGSGYSLQAYTFVVQ